MQQMYSVFDGRDLMARNFWDTDDLSRYVDVYRRQEDERNGKMVVARQRLETGYYLSDEVALATATRMLQNNTAPPTPQRS